jgi:hypothetical protein
MFKFFKLGAWNPYFPASTLPMAMAETQIISFWIIFSQEKLEH